jgi:hypothetical protein
MRTSVLLYVLAFPLLVACGAACAKSAADIGKPVCSHYDESTKPAASANASASPAASNVVAPAANGASPASRSGGTDTASHPRTPPHWQTFLPGMFR